MIEIYTKITYITATSYVHTVSMYVQYIIMYMCKLAIHTLFYTCRTVATITAGTAMAVPLFDKVTSAFYLFNCTYLVAFIVYICRYNHYEILNAYLLLQFAYCH